jgi:hypothetical protein
MKFYLAFAATLAFAAPAAATTVTLDFAGDICDTPTSACFNGVAISQSYGDIAGQVDVRYNADRSTPALSPLLYWSTGYETLTDVAYGSLGLGGISIALVAQTGFQITLMGFDIAPYVDNSEDTLVRVIDRKDVSFAFSQDFAPLSTEGVTSFSFSGPEFTSTTGFDIWLGPDAWNVGIDNIVFSVNPIDTNGGPTDPVDPTDPAVVPLPATALLLLGALGGLTVLRRRAERS